MQKEKKLFQVQNRPPKANYIPFEQVSPTPNLYSYLPPQAVDHWTKGEEDLLCLIISVLPSCLIIHHYYILACGTMLTHS